MIWLVYLALETGVGTDRHLVPNRVASLTKYFQRLQSFRKTNLLVMISKAYFEQWYCSNFILDMLSSNPRLGCKVYVLILKAIPNPGSCSYMNFCMQMSQHVCSYSLVWKHAKSINDLWIFQGLDLEPPSVGRSLEDNFLALSSGTWRLQGAGVAESL